MILIAIGCAAALIYGIIGLTWRAGMLRHVIKTLGVFCLGCFAFYVGAPVWLGVALMASALGDWLLDQDTDKGFLAGLVSFAVAHIFYIVVFFQLGAVPSVWAGAVFGLLALSALWWLIPYTGALKGPVIGYVVIIAIMGAAAVGTPLSLIWSGALLFILSDMILSITLFRWQDMPWPEGGAAHLVARRILWAAYFMGQALILYGVVAWGFG